jgi:two-component system cell cycle response regulator CtrA
MNVQDKVENLLGQMRESLKNPVQFDRLSDQLAVLTRGYLTPTISDPLPHIRLTPNQRSILSLFFAKMGQVISKGSLLDAAGYHHGWDSEPLIKTVDVYICQLRKRIKTTEYRIETVWGQGYRMVKTDEKAANAA